MCNAEPTAADAESERARIMRLRRDVIQSIRAQARVLNLAAADLGLPEVVIVIRRRTADSGSDLDKPQDVA
jgi:hypothetical protein